MIRPFAFAAPEPLEARLVTKTSLTDPKGAIALLLILWYSNNKPAVVEYGKESGAKDDGGISDSELFLIVSNYAKAHDFVFQDIDVQDRLKTNPLCVSQLEAINAAFELIWHLASIEFSNLSNRNAERTGGQRFRKKINYSANLDIIDAVVGHETDSIARVLLSWFVGIPVTSEKDMESRLIRVLTVFSETSLYKTSKTGHIFVPSGIYDALVDTNESVYLVDPDEESQGPTRIFKKVLSQDLNIMLMDDGGKAARSSKVTGAQLGEYSNRAKNLINLSHVDVDISLNLDGDDFRAIKSELIGEPRNLIYFGAPGTGKSYQLNKLAQEKFPDEHIRRITFHPEYSYTQFVGCFKPYSKIVESHENESSNVMASEISYRFVPGPFLETYIAAVQNPQKNFLLVIEEINRANPAAVFGDVFQLLDRNRNGRSEYEVAVSRELADYLSVFLPEYAKNSHISDSEELLSEQNRLAEEANRLSLPPNMYIWATMNSADQGVLPMDTAFKRRWDFRYMGINDGEVEIENCLVPFGNMTISWNAMRHAINNLMKDVKIGEDKWIGPFFISPDALNDERFSDVFKDKVLLYLYEDAGKMKRKALFVDEEATYSELCEQLDKEGAGIFKGLKTFDFAQNDPSSNVKTEG